MMRLLRDDDFEVFDQFLAPLTDTSMFLRSNARKAGMIYVPEKDCSAAYYGIFGQEILLGVLALCWNGMALCQVPQEDLLRQLFCFVLEQNPFFDLKGVLGPSDQVSICKGLVGDRPIALDGRETSYGLELAELKVPQPLMEGRWHCRLATVADLAILVPWRRDYDQEALNLSTQEPEASQAAHQETLATIEDGDVFVLEVEGQLVARADFNAALPGIVQIGGVWTPPPLRGRGYAKAVVAGALLEAKRRGATQATLFTKNIFAMKAYESLGFQAKGGYHILLFGS